MSHSRHRISKAEPRQNHHLWLEYADGASGEIDFTPIILRGGVFATLAEPGTFARVRIGEGGRYLEWPGEIDFCADALHEKPLALQERNHS